MKITSNILSIPPHLVTKWANVLAVYLEESILCIDLFNGQTVRVPDLQAEDIQNIFSFYEDWVEKSEKEPAASVPQPQLLPPFMSSDGGVASEEPNMGFGFAPLGGMPANVFQHDPDQMQSPDLPEEMLSKIAAVTRVIAPGEIDQLPKPEPHCNCPHCQITRSIHKGEEPASEEGPTLAIEDELVTEDDLRFRTWDIKQTGDQVYLVSNPLNAEEHYNVFLGDDIGCTCGEKNCEHIQSVLMS